MAPPIRDNRQDDLLHWSPPATVERFDDTRVRGVTATTKIARAIAEVLRDQATKGVSREAIAAAMSEAMGQEVSIHMLNAYAAPSREGHVIPLARFVALLHVTSDRRLLQVIAEMFGWAVIDRKYLPVIELASIRELEDSARRRRQALQAQARSTGAL